MALLNPFNGTETLAKAPINQDLMDQKIRENLEDLASQIEAISVGGGGPVDTGAIGSIIAGGETNEGIYWKKRFSPLQHMLAQDSLNKSGFDPEGVSSKNTMLTFLQSNDSGIRQTVNTNNYLGAAAQIAKSSKLSFKIKPGVNFFVILSTLSTNQSNNWAVFIDGQTPSSIGLVDENGTVSADTFSSSASAAYYQTPFFFYGLDSKEHVITIENNDSGSDFFTLDAVEVGYRSETVTIDESIHINAGKAGVRGSEVDFNDTDLTFGNTEMNGHAGSIVVDVAGVLTAVDGESPAMTQVRANEDIAFSSAVTTLPVKTNHYFPLSGICMLSTVFGSHHMFSYESKTTTTVQTNSLDDITWQSQPTEDFTPLSGFTGALASASGDLNINYWGTAPILISSVNNRVDFEITIAGVTTTHAATIASGRYAADIVPLEDAFRTAMQTVKPISGEYHLKYNDDSHIWNIYVEDDEVDSISFLFSTGLNAANSVHITLGFSATDITNKLSYLGDNQVEHLCCRVFDKDSVYMDTEDPRIKYSDSTASVSEGPMLDIQNRLGLGAVRRMSNGNRLMQIFVDDDCCGIEVNFVSYFQTSMLTFQIDDGQFLYLLQGQREESVSSSPRGAIRTAFISFPAGSKKITIRNESTVPFKISDEGAQIFFAGARQYFCKPAFEKLTKEQSVIKTLAISPVSLYATLYGFNSGNLYSPAASNDNINTITEVGSWAGFIPTTTFNKGRRRGNVAGDYVDFNFTLVGDGGGIFIKSQCNASQLDQSNLYISTAAINESTDLIQTVNTSWGTSYFDTDFMNVSGLPAGTYNMRMKNVGVQEFNYLGIGIVDTVSPQENANTISDIINTGQGISWPVNVRKSIVQRDSQNLVPPWLERSGYKEGVVAGINYSLNSPTFITDDDSTNIITAAPRYYGNETQDNFAGIFVMFSGFCKSVCSSDPAFSTSTTNTQPFIDGVQTLNSYSQRVQVKGGTAPSSTRDSTVPLTSKEFKLSCSFSAGDTFTISDTRGLKVDQLIILDDGTNKEKAVIASFVVGTSFTVKKARVTVVDANVTGVEFQGFHNYKLKTNDAAPLVLDCIAYEPLKISPSRSFKRNAQEFTYEKVDVIFEGVSNGNDLYYPVHSDGVVGNWTTSTFQLIGGTSLVSYSVPQNLKNIVIGSGTLDIKITSTRMIPVLDESERF